MAENAESAAYAALRAAILRAEAERLIALVDANTVSRANAPGILYAAYQMCPDLNPWSES
jgi:hypothetical protein